MVKKYNIKKHIHTHTHTHTHTNTHTHTHTRARTHARALKVKKNMPDQDLNSHCFLSPYKTKYNIVIFTY